MGVILAEAQRQEVMGKQEEEKKAPPLTFSVCNGEGKETCVMRSEGADVFLLA